MQQRRAGSAVLVDWIPGLQYTIAVALESYTTTDATAGIAQSDAVQLAAGLALLRTRCSMRPSVGTWALYDKSGAFLGEQAAGTAKLEELYKQSITPIVIVGDNELEKLPGGGELGDAWNLDLALACDQAVRLIADAKTGADVGGTVVATPALALPAVAIIVAGVAVTVIGASAAWRYLAPEARAQIAAVEKAAEAYTARLDVYRETGSMPPVSEQEKASAAMVKQLAAARRKNRWSWTAAAVGGGVGLVVGAAALRRAMA